MDGYRQTFMYVFMHAYMDVGRTACMNVCMYVCVCIHINMYMHTECNSWQCLSIKEYISDQKCETTNIAAK